VPISNSVYDVFGHRRSHPNGTPIQDTKPVQKQNWQNRWAGHEAFVIASGPSLTEEDVEIVRQWQNETRHVIVTNNTFLIAPFADVLFFHDLKWWNIYKNQVNMDAVTVSHISNERVNVLGKPGFKAFGNSGTGAVSLAIYAGCKKIYLLGVDGKKKDGKVHWHGNHVKPLGNAMSMPKWKDHFAKVGEYAKSKGVEVINMSRDTAIHCFKKQSIDELRG
jgi:hypothetical protein